MGRYWAVLTALCSEETTGPDWEWMTGHPLLESFVGRLAPDCPLAFEVSAVAALMRMPWILWAEMMVLCWVGHLTNPS